MSQLTSLGTFLPRLFSQYERFASITAPIQPFLISLNSLNVLPSLSLSLSLSLSFSLSLTHTHNRHRTRQSDVNSLFFCFHSPRYFCHVFSSCFLIILHKSTLGYKRKGNKRFTIANSNKMIKKKSIQHKQCWLQRSNAVEFGHK